MIYLSIKDLSKLRLVMYENKKIIIYNYNKLNQINDENISVDKYYIKGDDLKIKELVERVQNSEREIREVIIATNPDTEGESTSLYIADVLRGLVGKITRIGYGMPLGGHIDYIDEMTLSHSLKGRTKI